MARPEARDQLCFVAVALAEVVLEWPTAGLQDLAGSLWLAYATVLQATLERPEDGAVEEEGGIGGRQSFCNLCTEARQVSEGKGGGGMRQRTDSWGGGESTASSNDSFGTSFLRQRCLFWRLSSFLALRDCLSSSGGVLATL